MTSSASRSPLILGAQPLEGRLPGIGPFIFGAFHEDLYPRGNGRLGPDSSLLAGRDIGMDFTPRDGWRMYHGEQVPGFPAHPHRGFETVTIVRKGLVDHADSLGASARYGEGDVQWLTTGRGVQHGEMFPLVHQDRDNPLELYQLWLNLPARNKMAEPDFTMFWAQDIPRHTQRDAAGRRSQIEVIAGQFTPVGSGTPVRPLPPPRSSWASEADSEVAIWIVELDPAASLQLPAASAAALRALYLVKGSTLSVGEQHFSQPVVIEVRADQPAPLHNPGSEPVTVLVLQGRPINEPVAAHGPFVMNTRAELLQAIHDYQRTGFGGWNWPSREQTFGDSARFARHPDGRMERPIREDDGRPQCR